MPVPSCRCVLLAFMSGGRHWHNLIPDACSHITYISVHVMVHSVTLARLDILPEDGSAGTETCRRFCGIFSILMCVNMF